MSASPLTPPSLAYFCSMRCWAALNKTRPAKLWLPWLAEPQSRRTATTSSVEPNGLVQKVASTSLVCGDALVLTKGDAVVADELHVQAASLTEESLPMTEVTNAQSKSTVGCMVLLCCLACCKWL